MCNVTHTDISAGFKTDHSMVTIQIALHTNPKAPGFWKLNTSFLSETEYINQIRETIEGVKDEYQNDKSVNASLLWEMIKLKVREQTLRYAKTKKQKCSKKKKNWRRKLTYCRGKLIQGVTTPTTAFSAPKQLIGRWLTNSISAQ